jgi:hypothetical protein
MRYPTTFGFDFSFSLNLWLYINCKYKTNGWINVWINVYKYKMMKNKPKYDKRDFSLLVYYLWHNEINLKNIFFLFLYKLIGHIKWIQHFRVRNIAKSIVKMVINSKLLIFMLDKQKKIHFSAANVSRHSLQNMEI